MNSIGKLAPTCAACLGTFTVVAMMAGARNVNSGPQPLPSPKRVTFSRDIAPIVYANCAVCHHPAGPGPFSLLTYSDVRSRAGQIAEVTRSRYMPPWPPAPGYGDFLGERRLTEDEIQIIQRWVQEGEPEGSPSDLPAVPVYDEEGWALGKPDLVVQLSRPYILQPSGVDVFRNFVFHVPVTGTHYVKAVEIHPGNKRIVHHSNMLIDRSGASERADGKDGEVGFGGMEIEIESEQFEPQTHFVFWKAGTPPNTYPHDMSWVLTKGTYLVLNMHMLPSGKPEVIQPSIGLYFSYEPPSKFPMLIELEADEKLDIPAGDKNFVVSDSFRLPVDVQVLAVYPHAHYLGKDIEGFATLPDGTKQWLIWIKQWTFFWQAVYPYAKPVFLPQGSVVTMRYTYDNSSENPLNPNHPPRRVRGGNRSSDEMSHLWLQVLPAHRDDLKTLEEALMRHDIEKDPNDFVSQFNLGAVLQAEGKVDEAILHLRRALEIWPHSAIAENNLGAALLSQGKAEEALGHFRQALESRPDYVDAHYNLGDVLLSQGKSEEAISHFQAVLRFEPDNADAHNDLGSAYTMTGKLDQALKEFEAAIRSNPNHANAHDNLGYALEQEGKTAEAIPHFERAVEIKPKDADFHNDLGIALASQGNLIRAVAEFEQAVRINPQNAEAQRNLERARAELAKLGSESPR